MLGSLLDEKELLIEWFHHSHSVLNDWSRSPVWTHEGALYQPVAFTLLSSQVAGWEFSMCWAECMQCCTWFYFFPFALVTGRSSSICVCVCVGLFLRAHVCLCVCWSVCLWVWVCVLCVYGSWEIYSSEHAGFRGICGSGHKAWIALWLRSRPQSEVAPIRIQTTQAQHWA